MNTNEFMASNAQTNEILSYSNETLGFSVRCIRNLDGSVRIKLEDAAIGLKLVKLENSGKLCVAWDMVYSYLKELGISNCNQDNFISESLFHTLAAKASNNYSALNFKHWVVSEILPLIKGNNFIQQPIMNNNIPNTNQNNINVFNNNEFGNIRIINENGNILFCASDIAKALIL